MLTPTFIPLQSVKVVCGHVKPADALLLDFAGQSPVVACLSQRAVVFQFVKTFQHTGIEFAVLRLWGFVNRRGGTAGSKQDKNEGGQVVFHWRCLSYVSVFYHIRKKYKE